MHFCTFKLNLSNVEMGYKRKQDWNKMCREVCGPRDYLEEHKKRTLKKEKEMEAKYQGEEGEYM